jgi:ceramide glucosyltransferase
VTNVLAAEGTDRLGGILECLQLNSFVASAVSFARIIGGRACVIGKSMLFRRRDLARLGGFWAVRNVLAEDYVIGRAFELAGYKVAVSPHVVTTVNQGWTAERFINRHLRWAQMRRRLSLPAYVGELLLNPVLWITLALCAFALAHRQIDVRVAALGCAGIAMKCASDALLSKRLRGEWLPLQHVALIPLKDLLIAGIWLVAAFRRTVNWRGNLLQIEAGSALTPYQQAVPDGALQEVA